MIFSLHGFFLDFGRILEGLGQGLGGLGQAPWASKKGPKRAKLFFSIKLRFLKDLGRVWGGFGEGLGRVWGRFWEGLGRVLGGFWEGFACSRDFSALFWLFLAIFQAFCCFLVVFGLFFLDFVFWLLLLLYGVGPKQGALRYHTLHKIA